MNTLHDKSPARSRLFAKLGSSLITLFVLSLMGEAGARAAGFETPTRFPRVRSHEFLQRVPLPNQEQLVGVDDRATRELPVPLQISARGQRGADYPLEQAAGELHSVGLGDSLTLGRGAGDARDLPRSAGAGSRAHPVLPPALALVRRGAPERGGAAQGHSHPERGPGRPGTRGVERACSRR